METVSCRSTALSARKLSVEMEGPCVILAGDK